MISAGTAIPAAGCYLRNPSGGAVSARSCTGPDAAQDGRNHPLLREARKMGCRFFSTDTDSEKAADWKDRVWGWKAD